MNEVDPRELFLYVGVPLILAFYVFARFQYSVSSGRFVIDIRALGFIPVYRRTFDLERLVSLQEFRYPRDFFTLATPAGRLFSRQRCIIEFSGWRKRRLIITPASYDELLRSLEPYLQ